jgi:hypothetical protein
MSLKVRLAKYRNVTEVSRDHCDQLARNRSIMYASLDVPYSAHFAWFQCVSKGCSINQP